MEENKQHPSNNNVQAIKDQITHNINEYFRKGNPPPITKYIDFYLTDFGIDTTFDEMLETLIRRKLVSIEDEIIDYISEILHCGPNMKYTF